MASPSQVDAQLARLTVIIPTRQRPRELERVVRYWSRWPVRLIVIDGSVPSGTDLTGRVGRATLLHHHEPDLGARLVWAAQHIDSEFACLQPDDDFQLCRAVAGAVSWLDANPSFTCISGDGQFFTQRYSFTPSPQGRWVRDETPRSRLTKHFSDLSWSYVYGIHRAESLEASLSATGAALQAPGFLVDPNMVMLEFSMEVCGALLGKLGRSDKVLLLKATGNQTMDTRTSQSWDQWMTDPVGKAAFQAWRGSAAENLAPHLRVPSEVIATWIDEAFEQKMEFNAAHSARGGARRVTRAGVSVPLELTARISFYLRPRSHTSSDQRVSLPRRLARRLHRQVFRLVRALFRGVARILGKPRTSLPREEWDWGDPDDVNEFWAAVEASF